LQNKKNSPSWMFLSLKKLTILQIIKCTENQYIQINTYMLSHIITQHKNS